MYKSVFLCQINVTRDCNLRCEHCYISTDKKVQSKYMSVDDFKKVVDQLCDFLISRPDYKTAEVHIIGGEPSMLGYKFYQDVLPYARDKFSKIDTNVRLSLVTNLLTSLAVKIAKMFDDVSTSWEYNTRFITKNHESKPELENVWVDNCQKIIELNPDLGVTMAMTKQAIDRGANNILDYLYGIGFKKIHLGFFIPSGDGYRNLSKVFPAFEETTKFLKDATDWYLKKRDEDPLLSINPIESLISSIHTNQPNDDIVCPIIPGSLDIDWDGKTVTCIEAGGEVEFDSLGNVFESSITEIMSSKKYRAEVRKAVRVKPHCQGCGEINVCQMACGILHDFWDGEGECPGFKGFITHIRKAVEKDGVRPKFIA